MTLISKLVGDFVGLGKEVIYKGNKVRPEVKVAIASVYVESKTSKKSGLLNYSFRADGAQYGLNGFINESEAIVKVFDAASEKGEPVCVRFERKRKQKVDPTIPIADLTVDMATAKDNIVKTIVGVWDQNNKKWVLTREAQTNPEFDPEGTQTQIEQLSFDPDGFFDAPVPSGEPAYQSTSAEKEKENGSNALLNMYFFIAEQEKTNNFKLKHTERCKYATLLLKIANKLQVDHFKLENPSYSAYSHTRARYLIFKWAETVAPLNEESIANIKEWGVDLIKKGTAIWNWSEDEIDSI